MIGLSWRKCTGRLFQIVGVAKLNERFAVTVHILGTSRNDSFVDQSVLTGTLSWRNDAIYIGLLKWRMLKVATVILNSTGSQWSEHSTGRMCSYFTTSSSSSRALVALGLVLLAIQPIWNFKNVFLVRIIATYIYIISFGENMVLLNWMISADFSRTAPATVELLLFSWAPLEQTLAVVSIRVCWPHKNVD